MTIGEMDREVVLKTKTTTKDDWNYDTVTFVTLATVWAKKIDRLAGELISENQLISRNRTDWIIRHRTDVIADMVLEYNSETYDITATKEIGRREFLLIHTELRDNA
jgi:SPP1 family predicted phage head-tail adaptor